MNLVDSDRLIFLLVGAAIVLFNIGLIYSVLTGSAQSQLDILRRLAQKARQPWASENQALDELHQRIERLSGDQESDKPDG